MEDTGSIFVCSDEGISASSWALLHTGIRLRVLLQVCGVPDCIHPLGAGV